jgi:hypothetical protein
LFDQTKKECLKGVILDSCYVVYRTEDRRQGASPALPSRSRNADKLRVSTKRFATFIPGTQHCRGDLIKQVIAPRAIVITKSQLLNREKYFLKGLLHWANAKEPVSLW